MSKISVLGLGALGARMAAHLIKAGHDVTVWNRTADATKPSPVKWGQQVVRGQICWLRSQYFASLRGAIDTLFDIGD
jgi:6-phosphogluconate dehydrogenase